MSKCDLPPQRQDERCSPFPPPQETALANVFPNCAPLIGNDYQFIYSCDMSREAAVLGSVSLLLAILNIICIFLMGTIVMKVCWCFFIKCCAAAAAVGFKWRQEIDWLIDWLKTVWLIGTDGWLIDSIFCLFQIKELSPLPGATKGTVSFWKKDVAVSNG